MMKFYPKCSISSKIEGHEASFSSFAIQASALCNIPVFLYMSKEIQYVKTKQKKKKLKKIQQL